jgi:hypothetical protein
MSTTELRRQIKKKIDVLPPARLRATADYLAVLEGSSSTAKKKARFLARIAKAEKDIAAGCFVTLDQLKRKYQCIA